MKRKRENKTDRLDKQATNPSMWGNEKMFLRSKRASLKKVFALARERMQSSRSENH